MPAADAPTFEIILTVAATDPSRLWDAAAARLRSAGLDTEDIHDTIGVRFDPRIEDCLTTLLVPPRIRGGDVLVFTIRDASAQNDAI